MKGDEVSGMKDHPSHGRLLPTIPRRPLTSTRKAEFHSLGQQKKPICKLKLLLPDETYLSAAARTLKSHDSGPTSTPASSPSSRMTAAFRPPVYLPPHTLRTRSTKATP